jgi:hypothetical protein
MKKTKVSIEEITQFLGSTVFFLTLAVSQSRED